MRHGYKMESKNSFSREWNCFSFKNLSQTDPGIANCVTSQETSQTIVENRTRFPVSRFLRNFFQVSLSLSLFLSRRITGRGKRRKISLFNHRTQASVELIFYLSQCHLFSGRASPPPDHGKIRQES